MPEYHRVIIPGGTFFFTVVTWQRRPLFAQDSARTILRKAFQLTRERYPFRLDEICLLPDHLHCIWTLPEGESNYSIRWGFLKSWFSRQFLASNTISSIPNESRKKRREAAIWQRRFWEHAIRDEEDYIRHAEYIHNNPIKHGFVERAVDWPWSSVHRGDKANI